MFSLIVLLYIEFFLFFFWGMIEKLCNIIVVFVFECSLEINNIKLVFWFVYWGVWCDIIFEWLGCFFFFFLNWGIFGSYLFLSFWLFFFWCKEGCLLWIFIFCVMVFFLKLNVILFMFEVMLCKFWMWFLMYLCFERDEMCIESMYGYKIFDLYWL